MNIDLAFYGDDFTGSADAMEVLQWSGRRTVLFLEPPTADQLAAFPDLRAFGVAGTSRAMTPSQMDTELLPALKQLSESGARILHYKICSTFDSSPDVGSIGRVLELGGRFASGPIPILVAAPRLGRFQVFGNLFARSGLDTKPFRLDRHPTMVKHPITPMNEADLRLHLARQTEHDISLFDVEDLESEDYQQRFALTAKSNPVVPPEHDIQAETDVEASPHAVLLDALHERQMPRVGELINSLTRSDQALFVIGSSGVEYALTAHWDAKAESIQGVIERSAQPPTFASTKQLLVVTGSCSPVNARQIEYAQNYGFKTIAIDTPALINDETCDETIEAAVQSGTNSLRQGQNVILHSSLGPDDSRVAEARAAFALRGLTDLDIRLNSGRILGPALGKILRRILDQYPLPRAAVAGGDTSGFVARELGLYALEAIAPLAPGSPLCKAYSHNRLNGMELFFKGGQVGKNNVWETMLRGTAST